MSGILGMIIGVVVVIIGLYLLLFLWWSMFIRGLMALGPILLILIGVGVLIYFINEIKSKMGIGKDKASASGEKKSE